MSWLSKALHSSQGNTLFSFLVQVASQLVEANNPIYQPIITPVAQALQNEIASMAAGNSPTPHATDSATQPGEVPAAAVVTTTTSVATPATS